MTQRRPTKLRQAQEMIAERGERITRLERAFRRLQDLHDVSKLLTSFESAERTVPEVISVIARSVAVRSAIFLLGTTGAPLVITWPRENNVGAAKARAARMYDYLMRPGTPPAEPSRAERSSIMLPLVVDRSIFGALQIEGATPLTEPDLLFVNAIANQLAIAVDRAAAVTAQRVALETAEQHQHLLADLGAALVGASGSREGFAELARVVVPRIADVCVVDEVREDGSVERLETIGATEHQWALLDRSRARDVASVLDSGEPVWLRDLDQDDTERALAAGVTSLIVVRLRARGKTLGALTLGRTGRHYASADLAFAKEIAERAALGIDGLRLHEQTLHGANDLRHEVQLREDLLAVVSHDLRGPLGAIELGTASLLERHPDDDDAHRQLEIVRRAVGRMDHLIRDLLDMAKIQTGRFSLDRVSLDATTLVAEILDDLEPSLREKGIAIERELEPGVRLRIDRDRISQVFGNLLGNAKKFCRAGDVIHVRLVTVDPYVRFVVADTGPGIPEAELPHVFEAYWSAKRHERKGVGLGLYICKGIIEAHGGRIWVESQFGQGASFVFLLPLA